MALVFSRPEREAQEEADARGHGEAGEGRAPHGGRDIGYPDPFHRVARSRQDVDRCAALLREIGAKIVRGPMEGTWAPGYYYVLFEDPDGIRLEVNFVPGAGLLAEGVRFNPGTGYA